MKFSTQKQAKKFFIDKIILQAQKDRIHLSEAEKYMLEWADGEEGFEFNNELTEQFKKETTEEEFEKKITKVFSHAYENDMQHDKEMKGTYQNAYRTLKKGDYYLLVMIEETLKSKSRSLIKDRTLLVISALAVGVTAFFSLFFLSNWFSDEIGEFLFSCLLYLVILYSWTYVEYIRIKIRAVHIFRLFVLQTIVGGILIAIAYLLFFEYKIVPMPNSFKILIFVLAMISIFATELLTRNWEFLQKKS